MCLNTKKRLTRGKKFLILIISIYFNVFQCISTFSQDSLSAYMEIAGKNNPGIMQKYYEYQAALQKVPEVGSLPDPELSVGVFLSPMELISGNQVADIRLMQMFPWFGVLSHAKDEMGLMAKAKYESFRDAKVQVYFEVQRNYFEMQRIKEEIHITKKNRELLENIEQLLLVKYKSFGSEGNGSGGSAANSSVNQSQTNSTGAAGMGTMNRKNSSATQTQPAGNMTGSAMGSTIGGSGLADLYKLQIEKSDVENSIELLSSKNKTLVARFNASLNRPANTPVSLPDSLLEEKSNLASLSLTDSMFESNPMLGMLQYESQSLDARKEMVTRMGYPMIGIGVNYSLINKSEMSTSAMNGKDMIMPMVTLTLPIYRKKYKSLLSETSFLKQANAESYKSVANSLQTEYFESLQSFNDALSKIHLYKKQSLIAKQTFDLMVNNFSVSGAGLSEVLRIRQQLNDYQLRQVEAITEYNISIAAIKRLTSCTQIK